MKTTKRTRFLIFEEYILLLISSHLHFYSFLLFSFLVLLPPCLFLKQKVKSVNFCIFLYLSYRIFSVFSFLLEVLHYFLSLVVVVVSFLLHHLPTAIFPLLGSYCVIFLLHHLDSLSSLSCLLCSFFCFLVILSSDRFFFSSPLPICWLFVKLVYLYLSFKQKR